MQHPAPVAVVCCYRGVLLTAVNGERHARTAEALMRARYTAYAQQHASYLLASWHATMRPEQLELHAGIKRRLPRCVGVQGRPAG